MDVSELDTGTTDDHGEGSVQAAASTPHPPAPPLTRAPAGEAALLLAALALGIAFDAFTNGRNMGVGATLVVALLAAALVAFHGRFRLSLPSRGRWPWVAAVVALGASFAYRDSPDLVAFNLLAMYVASVLVAVRVIDRRLLQVSFGEFARAAVELPFSSIARAVRALGRQLPKRSTPEDESASSGHGRDILIGCLVAVPILALFTSLLAAADEGFARLLHDLFDWNFEDITLHLLLIAVGSIAAASYLIGTLAAVPMQHQPERRTSWAGPAVVWIVLGSTAVLFMTFASLQAGYLFGGADYLTDRAHLTAAEYARRGFFELVLVAALVVPLLLVFRRWHADTPGANRAFRITAPLLAGLTIVLIASAFARLFIYGDRFGLTIDRLNAGVVLLWLALGLGWMGVRIALGRTPQLATFAAATGIGLVLLLDLANPVGIVATTNLTRNGGSVTDVDYLMDLGADAVPAITAHLDEVDAASRHDLARRLLQHSRYSDGDWRNANLARHRADAAIDEHRDQLERLEQRST